MFPIVTVSNCSVQTALCCKGVQCVQILPSILNSSPQTLWYELSNNEGGGGVAFRYDVRIALCYGVIFVSVASFSCVKGLHSMLASLEKCISDELYNL